MLSALLAWVFIGLQLLCGIGIPWYLDRYTEHLAGYHPWIYGALLIAGSLAQAWDKISAQAANRALEADKGHLSAQVQTLQGNLGQLQDRVGQYHFLKDYTETLSSAVDTLQELNGYDVPQVKLIQRQILKYIASVVLSYFSDKVELEVNAGLMEPKQTSDFAISDFASGRFLDGRRVYFADQSRPADEYRAVLAITAWAHNAPGVPRDFAIPVDGDNQRLLFGAARAFASGDETVIGDVKDPTSLTALLEGQPPAVKRDALEFFAKQQYVSFVSLPIEFAGQIVAVLNIQSNKAHIFGENELYAADIKRFISPLRSILGILVWREDAITAKDKAR